MRLFRFATCLALIFVAQPLFVPRASAQLVADGASRTLDNLDFDFGSGNLTVGTNGANTLLTFTNASFVANLIGYIGYNAGASNNQVTVTDAGSLWTNSRNLYIGYSGQGNSLLVTNGALLGSVTTDLGFSVGASNNEVIVTETHSLWTNRFLINVGNNGSSNFLLITNGGTVADLSGQLGLDQNSSNNQAVVTGTGSMWSNASHLYVGYSGNSNRLLVTDGGIVAADVAVIGFIFGSVNNQAAVIGTGSLFAKTSIIIGYYGTYGALLVSNGGQVTSAFATIGLGPMANNNQVTVTGAGSFWNNSNYIRLADGSSNTLLISFGGAVQATNLFVGASNRLSLESGTLTVTNADGTGVMDVGGGVDFNGGSITADHLQLTNSAARFTFNTGVLNAGAAAISNGVPFIVGDGTRRALYKLTGNLGGIHSFANDLMIANNATLSGNGTIGGRVTVAHGGTLGPATLSGLITLSNSPTLLGQVSLQIGDYGATISSSQIAVALALTYGGSLVVSNVGPDKLAAGDAFQLFNAPVYAGAFSAISLPRLGPGLNWTNQLLTTGSIAIVPNWTGPTFSSLTPSGANLLLGVTSGVPGAAYNLLSSTNLALPLSNWTTNQTGNFDWLGNMTLTNAVNPAGPQQYFLISIP